MHRSDSARPPIGNPRNHQQSDSLIASLCRETCALRCRCGQVIEELGRTREGSLRKRLCIELATLQRRQEAIGQSVGALDRERLRDPLGLEFLRELTRRPVAI